MVMADMPGDKSPRMLDQFEYGHPGPAAIPFSEGSLRIVSVLIYRDGLVIDWLMDFLPARKAVTSDDPRAAIQRLDAWVTDAQLDDDQGTIYVPDERREFGGGAEGARGRMAFYPAPPRSSTLIFRMAGATVRLSL